MRGRVSVTFYGEEGIDAGGLLREWYVERQKNNRKIKKKYIYFNIFFQVLGTVA
jgi:hypothetical protein